MRNARDSIPPKIEEELERSRMFVLCISAKAFGRGSVPVKSSMFPFRAKHNPHLI